jgi:hypothetical protein
MTDEEINLYFMHFIQERRGKSQKKDRYYCPKRNKEYTGGKGEASCPAMCNSCIWIPPLSEPENPGRGLLGMLQDFKEIKNNLAGDWSVYRHDGGRFDAATPELAVLKAIEWEQKGK